MNKQKLFEDDSEEEVSLKTENAYAKKYDKWREKEELHKLEQKYGSKALNSDGSSSDSEDESDDVPEVSEEMEEQFLKTLSLLKTKDPRIYDPGYKCFEDSEKKETEKQPKSKTLTFADSDESDDDDGNIFNIEKKAEIVEDKDQKKPTGAKDGKIKGYLTGQVQHIDEEVEKDLAPLKALWSDPKLNEGEAFLRDYILNKRYLEDGDVGEAQDKIRDDEELEADEERVEEQGKFERAYNFRFEEPDQEYLKRFPRTMNYIRPKDDARSRKRADVRARKLQEKQNKMDEISRLKVFKLREIQEKIAKIKEVTGNEDLAFKDEDLNSEFDPEEHDKRMREIFDEQYYGDADQQKPVFPELDEELEIENWDKYEPEEHVNAGDQDDDGPHCEDEDFNMDADYDPKKARDNLLEEVKKTLEGKKRRNRKKKAKLALLLESEKPKFVPTVAEKTYSQYMEEYYKMDCEDVIGGDLPTRFKYREVMPNDYGLTVEEILLADDRELTQWVPLKKILKHRPNDLERGDAKTYAMKAQDKNLKKKILPSLFKELPEEADIVVPTGEAKSKGKKKKKKDKNKEDHNDVNNQEVTKNVNGNQEVSNEDNSQNEAEEQNNDVTESPKKKKHKNKSNLNGVLVKDDKQIEDEQNVELNKQKRKFSDSLNNIVVKDDKQTKIGENKESKKKKQKSSDSNLNDVVVKDAIQTKVRENVESNKKKRKLSDSFIIEDVSCPGPSKEAAVTVTSKKDTNLKRKASLTETEGSAKKFKSNNKKNNKKKFTQNSNFKNKNKGPVNPLTNLSDERLKAYGLNPKKYKNFLHFKKY